MRKNLLNKVLVVALLAGFATACKKSDFTPVDMNELNPVSQGNSDLDKWLKANFLDPYNSAVYYRYNRYYHEADRNVTPPDVDKVQPMMQRVLSGFVNPYRDVAGINFMKTNMPREWVLYGSTSYDASGVGYAGTASGGVRVNLFGLNNFANNATFLKGPIKTIHHEFVHILNQKFAIPADFAQITKAFYNGNWTSTNADSAHKWGYVSTYASQNPTEDYAETASHLLVYGQPWFETRIKTCPAVTGQTALRLKEQNVANYYTNLLGVDFRGLQKQMFLFMKDSVQDASFKFPQYLNSNLYRGMLVNHLDPMYSTYGNSSGWVTAYDNLKNDVMNYSATNKYRMESLQFRFENSTTLVVRMAFTATAGSAINTTYNADYNFSVAVNSTTGLTTFTKTAQGTTTTYTNAAIFLTSFTNNITSFLTAANFTADWIPDPKNLAPVHVARVAGFTSVANPGNYFYGTLATTL